MSASEKKGATVRLVCHMYEENNVLFALFLDLSEVAAGTNKQKHQPPERFPDTSATRTRSARSPAAAATARKQNYLKGARGNKRKQKAERSVLFRL